MELTKDYLLKRASHQEAVTLADRMLQIVLKNPQFYEIYTQREKMEVKLRNTRSIYLRSPKNFSALNVKATTDTAHLLDCENNMMWPVFSPYIDQFIQLLAREFGMTRFGRAFITKLLPRTAIDEHIDFGHYFKSYHRFHLPLQTMPGCSFTVEDYNEELVAGDVYVLNNCRPHSVNNTSDIDRIHLIVDAA